MFPKTWYCISCIDEHQNQKCGILLVIYKNIKTKNVLLYELYRKASNPKTLYCTS